MNIGIDVGAQTIKVGAKLNGDYKIKSDILTPTDFDEAAKIVKEQVLSSFGKPARLVLGCFGLFEPKEKKILSAPNLPRWIGKSFKEWEKILGCPIILENDANLAIFGEAKEGAGKGKKIVAGFTLGTGVGYGCVMDGKNYHGNFDVEGGHMILDSNGPKCGCGQKGCLEAYVSSKAILERFGKEPHQLEDEKAWDFIAHKIAWGCQIVTVVIKPDMIVLCGGTAQHKWLLEKVQGHYQNMLEIYTKEIPRTEIALGKFVPHSGVIGAIEMANGV